uniref:EGF-like domain-containing protein n=1 Tax=Panagrolaimus sp. ES5 TaxID=591445 RepID=A0AC34FH27_9BILA
MIQLVILSNLIAEIMHAFQDHGDVMELQIVSTVMMKKHVGVFDCQEKDDENGCDQIVCGEGEFKCRGFTHHVISCIPNSWICDGKMDCVDMSDEKECEHEEKKVEKCANDEFKCKDGECILKSWQCDGEFDCKDDSDEDDRCKNQTCDSSTHFQCNGSHFCLPKSCRCDGQSDCPDHSDEKDCTEVKVMHPVTCSKDEFKCKNGAECIRDAWVCDGDTDCTDASDEANCTESDRKCGVDEVLCPDNICRESCDTTHKRFCIPLHRLCDGNSSANDCIKSVCDQKIIQCNPNDSPYCLCRDTTQGGKVCFCPSGYERRGDNCIDIDECQQPGICDQQCTNLMGTYKCSCYTGFQLTRGKIIDGEGIFHSPTKCRAVHEDPLLILSNRGGIRQYNLVTKNYHLLINNLDFAVSMDYWYESQYLIWADVSKKQILLCRMYNITKNSFKCFNDYNRILIDKNISKPAVLAVDWIHGLLFWTDSGLNTINVYNLVNYKRKLLINTSLQDPNAIAVDPIMGLIFWSDLISTQKIERAGMDGEDRVEVISGDRVRWPTGLAVDVYEQRIYWADAKTKAISACDYWGKNVLIILHSHQYLKHPLSLTIFEDRVHWTDRDHEGVLSANKFHGEDVKRVLTRIPGQITVKIYHQMAQPKFENICFMHECQHLCLPKAFIQKTNVEDEVLSSELPYSCACDMGFELSDLTKCVSEKNHTNLASLKITVTLHEESEKFNFADYALLICVGYFVLRQKRAAGFSVLNYDNPIYFQTAEEGIKFDNSVGANPFNSAM